MQTDQNFLLSADVYNIMYVDICGSRAICVCSYESACEEYLKALDLLRSSEEADMGPVPKSYIGNFIVNRVRP